jgi:hypothetical protein
VVIDDSGNVQGVFLPFDEYQKLTGGKSAVQTQEDIAETVNREILQAQLEEVISSLDGGTAQPETDEETLDVSPVERIDALLNKRAQELFRSMPHNSVSPNPMPYNYTAPPEVATTSDEEMKPNFDDI